MSTPIPIPFDSYIVKLRSGFSDIKDTRRSNRSISLPDVLLSAFAMFSLKCASLLEFDTRSRVEAANLQSVYRIETLCSDTQMRTVLDQVSPAGPRHQWIQLVKSFLSSPEMPDYRYLNGKRLVSIDGVEHFHSKTIHCEHCLSRTHRDGTTSYHHNLLCAVLVHPERSAVFPLDAEPIVQQDGSQKNDCELNAAKRLIVHLAEAYPREKFIICEDALFSNGPHLRQLISKKWSYISGIKPESHPTLFKQMEGRLRSRLAKQATVTEKGDTYQFTYANNLALSESAHDVRVNVLMVTITDPQGHCTRFSWITDITLKKSNLMCIMRGGRARWKIENETFNTLKNQGYHFEHNYGHGQKYLATNLAFLMLTAFLIDQIQQSVCKVFKTLWNGLKTKVKLWKSIRSVFEVQSCLSMEQLYQTIAQLYAIQLE